MKSADFIIINIMYIVEFVSSRQKKLQTNIGDKNKKFKDLLYYFYILSVF